MARTPSSTTRERNIDVKIRSEEVKTYYEQWWENPDDIRNVIFNRLNEVVLRRIRGYEPARALDLGSGKGRILSMLVESGFSVTSVEFNPNFTADLRSRFPGATIVGSDVRTWQPDQQYDLVTCIELAQVLTHEELAQVLRDLRPFTRRILINVSNKTSMHGVWARLRGFQAPFIVTYTAEDLVRILRESGYRPAFSAGIGFLTPISLLRDFKLPIVGERLATFFEKLDKSFPRLCHLFLVEADTIPVPEG